MKDLIKHIFLGLFLPLALAACSYEEVPQVEFVPDGMAQVQLGVRVSAPVATRAMSDNENAVVENDTIGFVVFAFDPDASTLLWVIKSGDKNYESNLESERKSSAIRWRSGYFPSGMERTDDDAQYGTLYIEAPETDDELELIVLANVDLSVVTTNHSDGVITSYVLSGADSDFTLTPDSSTMTDVETALSAFDYSASALTGTWGPVTDVWDEDGNENVGTMGTENTGYIPFAGRATLSGGVNPGATASVSLRRSLAKVSVTVEFSSASVARFLPQELKIVNVNDYATVYSPDVDGEQATGFSSQTGTYTAMNFYESFPGTVLSTDALSVTAELYVPESLTWPTEDNRDTHLCVLVGGVFNSDGIYDFGGGATGTLRDFSNWAVENPNWTSPLIWYRLDFIPSDASSTEDELSEILRNHHYRFTVTDLGYLGSYTETAAMAMLYPDNYVIAVSEDGTWTLYVEDEDINSVTVAYESSNTGDTEVSDYVGVSATDLTIELPASADDFTGNEATHISMVTNYQDWEVDNGIDLGNCEGVFSFSYADEGVNENVYWYNSETDEYQYATHSGSLWVWADGQSGTFTDAEEALETARAALYTTDGSLDVDTFFTFYICVGVVRKEIYIHLAVED